MVPKGRAAASFPPFRVVATSLTLVLGFQPSADGGQAPPACDRANFAIVLDVGHTPTKPGAISARGATEYSFNLALARVVSATLQASGFAKTTVLLTSADGQRGLIQRAERAQAAGANLIVSVHHDSVQLRHLRRWMHESRERLFNDDARGFSLFVSEANPQAEKSRGFAEALARELLARKLPFTTHHAPRGQGVDKPWVDPTLGIYRFDGLTLLRHAHSPAVLLEAGVIVNRDEELALSTTDRRQTIAHAVAAAVETFCAGYHPRLPAN